MDGAEPTSRKRCEKWGTRLRLLLLLIDEVTAAILLPAAFVLFHAERLFLAVADGLDAAGADSSGGQGTLHCAGTLVAQSQVVFGRAAAVAVSLNREVDAGVLAEELRVGLDDRLLIAVEHRTCRSRNKCP